MGQDYEKALSMLLDRFVGGAEVAAAQIILLRISGHLGKWWRRMKRLSG